MIPVNAFDLLPEGLRRALRRRGITRPTPVQEKAIPVILKGFHTLIMAPTGSGKTEAALLPVAAKIMNENMYGRLRVLYITPLRALNRDIGLRSFELFKEFFSVDVWHGDTPQSRRRKIAEKPPEILVTTPESLNVLLVNQKMREHLRDIKFVIVDELHELIEDERGAELTVALERLSRIARFQRIGISATVSDVETAKRFLGGMRYVVEVKDETAKRPQLTVFVEDGYDNMVERTKKIIREVDGTVLIFTNTRDTAEALGKTLREEFGDSVAVHHGSLSKKEREKVERLAREGKLKAIVATASLELGIDIGSIKHVVQFTSPRRVTNLVQRVGRSEHKPYESPKGSVVTGLKPYEAFEATVIARRAQAGNLEGFSVHKNPLDVLAHQIVGILMEGPIRKKEVYDLVRRAYPFWDLPRSEFDEVWKLLEDHKLIKCEKGACAATKKGQIYYRTTGMIVESKRYKVVTYGTNDFVGTLDEEFVVELNPGDTFVLAGKVWRVVGIEEEQVLVEEEQGEGPPPSWEGELIPVEKEVAREVGALKRLFDKLIANYPVTDESKDKLKKFLEEIDAPVATDKRVVIEVEDNVVVYNVHGGSKVNLALAYALSELAKLRYGSSSFNTTPYHIILFLPRPISPGEAKDLLFGIRDWFESLVESAARNSKLYAWRLMKVLVRMGLLDRKRVTLDELKKVERTMKKIYLDLPPGREALREIYVDKLDIDGAKRFLEGLEKLEVVAKRGFSAQSRWAVEKAGYAKDVSSSPKVVIKEAVKRRLEGREVTLVCLLCGYERKGKVKDVELVCKCGSRIMVPVFNEKELYEVVKKMARGERLRGKEKKLADEARERASLLASYGRLALLVMAGRGIGPKTAKRLLREVSAGLKDPVEAVMEAEKTYLRTRRFW